MINYLVINMRRKLQDSEPLQQHIHQAHKHDSEQTTQPNMEHLGPISLQVGLKIINLLALYRFPSSPGNFWMDTSPSPGNSWLKIYSLHTARETHITQLLDFATDISSHIFFTILFQYNKVCNHSTSPPSLVLYTHPMTLTLYISCPGHCTQGLSFHNILSHQEHVYIKQSARNMFITSITHNTSLPLCTQ